jgi:methyl-accepting chemotaxis protein
MRILVGLLAMLLGLVGVIACVAGCGGAWWGSFELARQVDQFTARADESLGTADDALTRMSAKVEATSAAVEKVRSAADVIASGRTADADPAAKARVARLFDELSPYLERTDALADSLRSLGTVLENVASVTSRIDDGAKSARLRSAADKLGTAAATLGSVGERAASIRQGGAAPRAQELVRLADDAGAVLDRLGGGMSDVRRTTEEIRKQLPEVRRAAGTWKFIVPAALTVVLIWVGLGQLCLIGWGRRRLRKPEALPTASRA